MCQSRENFDSTCNNNIDTILMRTSAVFFAPVTYTVTQRSKRSVARCVKLRLQNFMLALPFHLISTFFSQGFSRIKSSRAQIVLSGVTAQFSLRKRKKIPLVWISFLQRLKKERDHWTNLQDQGIHTHHTLLVKRSLLSSVASVRLFPILIPQTEAYPGFCSI